MRRIAGACAGLALTLGGCVAPPGQGGAGQGVAYPGYLGSGYGYQAPGYAYDPLPPRPAPVHAAAVRPRSQPATGSAPAGAKQPVPTQPVYAPKLPEADAPADGTP